MKPRFRALIVTALYLNANAWRKGGALEEIALDEEQFPPTTQPRRYSHGDKISSDSMATLKAFKSRLAQLLQTGGSLSGPAVIVRHRIVKTSTVFAVLLT